MLRDLTPTRVLVSNRPEGTSSFEGTMLAEAHVPIYDKEGKVVGAGASQGFQIRTDRGHVLFAQAHQIRILDAVEG